MSARLVTDSGVRFASYAAHELRSPLATQRALLELALGDPGTDAGSWREIGEEVLRACGRQERLVDACLTLARSRRGPQRREQVDLAAIAAEALRAYDPSGLERVVALEPAWTSGDPDLLGRLAANLVSNAIRHNVAGGRIEVATRAEAGRAVLSFANSGPLIAARELDCLFEPFQRLGSSEGVGLGLAIVQAIVDAHGATVSARALGGGGLEIEVSFPGRERRAARRAERSARPVAAVIATACLAVLAAACGGSPANHVATAGAAAPGGSAQVSRAIAYAHCMRSNGVGNWPDPDHSGVFDKSKLTTQQLGTSDAQLAAAQRSCQRLLPNGGSGPSPAQVQSIRAQALRYSQCVRAHGVEGFPDPGSDGRIPDPASAGIDQGSPKFQAANQACGRYRPPYMPSNAAYSSWARMHPS